MRPWTKVLLTASMALLCSCAGVRNSPYVLSVSGVISSPSGPESGAEVELVGLSMNGGDEESPADPVQRFSEPSGHRAVATTDEWGRYDVTLGRFDHRFVFTYFPPLGAWLNRSPRFVVLIKLGPTPSRILRVFSHEDGSIKFTAYDTGGAVLSKSDAGVRMIEAAFETKRTWSGLPIQGHVHVEFEVESLEDSESVDVAENRDASP